MLIRNVEFVLVKRWYIWSLLFWCNLFGLLSIYGQLPFKSFTIEDGLSQNSVYAITQTKEGLLWLGTHDGLNSFDGNQFTTYIPATDDQKKRSAIIQTIAIYDDDHLLIGTSNELLIFDLKRRKFLPHDALFDNLELPSMVNPRKIIVRNGEIYILTLSFGLYKYHIRNKTSRQYAFKDDPSEKLTDIDMDQNQRIWLCSESRVYLLENDVLKKIDLPKAWNINKLNIRTIKPWKNSLLLSLTDVGVKMLDVDHISKTSIENQSIQHISFYPDVTKILPTTDGRIIIGSRSHGVSLITSELKDTKQDYAGLSTFSIKKNYILSLFEDRSNTLWVGLSGGGLAKLINDDKLFDVVRFPLTKNFNDNMIFAIETDDDSTFYLGTLTSGLVIYHKKNQSFQYYFDQNLPTGTKNIYDIEQDGQLLWLATWEGLCSFNKLSKRFKLYKDQHFFKATKLYSIKYIRENNMILASGEYGLSCFNTLTKEWQSCYDQKSFLSAHNVVARYMEKISSTEIGLSTLDRNFLTYDYAKGIFTEYPEFQALSVSSRYFHFQGDHLWIATDDGLIQAEASTKNILKFWTRKNGLNHDFVYAVLSDKKNHIWMTHNKGISRIQLAQAQITNFTLKDGLQDLEFNTASCYKTKGGNLLFGGINGLNYIDIDKIKKPNYTIKPIISRIKVMNEDIEHDQSPQHIDSLQLTYKKNWISFDFVSPNPPHEDVLLYKYKLEGFDDAWIDLGNRSYASYNNLKPGNYRFLVKSYDNNGNESQASDGLTVIISKPLWQKWGFQFLVVALVISALIYIYYIRFQSLKKSHETQLLLSDLETKAIQLQMNSHFIFNCLNNISQMILVNDNKNAVHFLQKFAGVIREKLNQSKQNFVLLAHELDYIFKYVELEKLRMESLQYFVEIEDGIDVNQYKIPTNILQPLIEKAIWLNESKTKNKIVSLKISQSKTHIHCDIPFCDIIMRKDANILESNTNNFIARLDLINEKYKKQYRLEYHSNKYLRFIFPNVKNT